MFKKIAIFGVGLIGGSFALALKKAGVVDEIVGVGRSASSLEKALQMGVIDRIANDVADAVQDADLIMLAVPVAQTEATLSSIKPYLQASTIISDTGSTKADVIAAARRALGEQIAQFVPAHPIAGREVSGVAGALADLYVGKKVVITRLAENADSAVELVARVWQQTGALLWQLTPEEHDAIFASVSHLPHLLAFALVDDITRKPHAELLFQFAASGFRDFTRIAGSSPEMWRDIALGNRAALLVELESYMDALARLRLLIKNGDGAALEAIFANASQARQTWQSSLEK